MTRKRTPVSFHLMSGEDAAKPENVLKLFEQIKGRKATAQEVADLMALQPPAPKSSRRRTGLH
jgi:hypothetical protein